MKKNAITAILGMLVIAISSCKKENLSNPAEQATPVAPNERLLISEDRATDSRKFYYNADKTLKSFTWGNGTVEATITYLPNKMLMTHQSNGVKYTEFSFELSGGIAQKATIYSVSNPGEHFEVRYHYNNNKQLVKIEWLKNSILIESTHRTYDSNGDMIINETRNANGLVTRLSNYEYDLTSKDKSGSWGQFDNNGTGSIFPRISQHLIKKLTVNENNTVKIYNYAYTLDATGFVETCILKDENGNTLDSYVNAWQ